MGVPSRVRWEYPGKCAWHGGDKRLTVAVRRGGAGGVCNYYSSELPANPKAMRDTGGEMSSLLKCVFRISTGKTFSVLKQKHVKFVKRKYWVIFAKDPKNQGR